MLLVEMMHDIIGERLELANDDVQSTREETLSAVIMGRFDDPAIERYKECKKYQQDLLDLDELLTEGDFTGFFSNPLAINLLIGRAEMES